MGKTTIGILSKTSNFDCILIVLRTQKNDHIPSTITSNPLTLILQKKKVAYKLVARLEMFPTHVYTRNLKLSFWWQQKYEKYGRKKEPNPYISLAEQQNNQNA